MTTAGLAAFGTLTRAESVLVAGIGNGSFDRVGAGGVPSAGNEDRRVRADLVRALLLGGPDLPAMHEKGMRLGGAWITGILDLEGCRIPHDIGLLDCRFEAVPVLLSAVIDTLAFDGSVLPGLAANRLEARGDLLFRAATVEGQITLRGARIGGDLVFDGATLAYPDDLALAAPGIAVRGSAQFRGTSVRGGLSFPGARIDGSLDMVGLALDRPGGVALDADSSTVAGDAALRQVQITGLVSIVTSRIGGDADLTGATLSNPGDIALRLNRTTAGGAFFLREGARIDGALSLNGAAFGAMMDDPACWPAPGDLLLNRCLYTAFIGSPVTADLRLKWLALQSPARWGEDFWPQPYEHLAKVLKDLGHDEDARRVLIEKERLARRARRRRAATPLTRTVLWLGDGLERLTTGYGRKPLLALVWMLGIWAAGSVLYAALFVQDVVRPNVMVVLRSPEWVLCGVPQGQDEFLSSVGQTRDGLAAPGQSQLRCFLDRPEASAYPKYNPMMLSLDAMIPGVETGQRNYWSPDTRMPLGLAGKWFLYFQTLAGWVLGLLAVAGFYGVVKTS